VSASMRPSCIMHIAATAASICRIVGLWVHLGFESSLAYHMYQICFVVRY
jgi:hypothetical protein